MIVFAGDPHGDFKPLIQAVESTAPEAVILLGDLDLERPLHEELAPILDKTEVWFIPGNHDTDQEQWYDRLFHSDLADRNLHGRVAEINGKRVAGLGGVFRDRIWRAPAEPKFRSQTDFLATCGKHQRWRGGIPLKHHATIFWKDYEALWNQSADILVTHEAPSCHRYGFKALDELAEAMGVQTIFHGHHHEQYSATICSSRITVHGVSRAGITDEQGNVLIAGKQDEQRRSRCSATL